VLGHQLSRAVRRLNKIALRLRRPLIECLRADIASFRRSEPTAGAAEASFVAYDLLRFQGADWRSMLLEVRRAQLGSLVDGIDGLTFSAAIEGGGALVFDHACKLGLEGSSRSV
jgi:hypothetical protein